MKDDIYWSGVTDFLRQHVHSGEKIVAPVRFKEKFENVYSYSFTYGTEIDYFDWVLIHKGLLEKVNVPFLTQTIRGFKPVFANEVFVVFTNRDDLAPEKINPTHLQSLLKNAGLPLLPEATNPLQSILRRFKSGGKSADRGEEMANQLRLIGKRLVMLEKSLNRLEETTQKRGTLKRDGKAIAALSKEAFTNACRASCQTAYLGNDTILCRVLGRYLLYADSQDVGIVPHLSMDGYWEAWMTLAVARVVQSGWHCVDVGANHGYYTLLIGGMVGKTGRVVALEPNPRLADLVKRTIAVNGFQDQITVLTEAVSETAGETLKLVIPKGLGMNASLIRNAIASDEVIEVQTTTLDQLTASWEKVDFLKIDAEGAEEMIWRGMQETIYKHPHLTIVLEFNDMRSPNPQAFLELIQQVGFTLRHIDFDAEIKEITLEQCLTERKGKDWLLFLQK